MKKTNIHKLVFAAVLVALAVVGSLISFPIGASKCAPVQHLVNIIGAVFLGPAWAVGVGFTAALLRNLLGLGSLLAFPGSMVGAFVAGMLYKYIKKLPAAYVGELFGTSVLGGLLAYPVARFLVGAPAAAITVYILPFFVSCAGGVRAQCEIELGSREASSKNVHTVYEITVGGLQGGHSGVEIHKQHANAIKVLGSLLTGIQRECDICVSDITGGGKENAIPKEATAFIAINSDESPAFVKKFREYKAILQQEYKAVEPDIAICLEKKDIAADIYSLEASKNIIYVLGQAIDGVCRMSTQIQGMVETSLNLGTVFIKDDKLVYRYLIRSNTASGKRLVLDKVSAFAEFAGGKAVTTSDYPAWEYSSDSRLRNVMIESFKSVYGREPEVTSIHAGLECGILSGRMPGVDMISFGPTLVDVHTPDEYMDIASVKRSWNYLLEVLRNI